MWDLIPGPWNHALSQRQTLNHWPTQASLHILFLILTTNLKDEPHPYCVWALLDEVTKLIDWLHLLCIRHHVNTKHTKINNADSMFREVTVYERKLRCNTGKAHSLRCIATIHLRHLCSSLTKAPLLRIGHFLFFFFNLFFIGVQFTNIQNNPQCPSPIHSHPPSSSPSTTPRNIRKGDRT